MSAVATVDQDKDTVIRCHQSILTIDRRQWNRLLKPHDAPFLEWEWFAALEESGSISAQNGWQPLHVALYRKEHLLAVAPLYGRSHSWGELVFDHGWQQLAGELGKPYFPKLVGMIPATPCTAYRFLCDQAEDEQELIDNLIAAITLIGKRIKAQSTAFHFVDGVWHRCLLRYGFLPWVQSGFRWYNRTYRTYGDYLSHFNKNQRRNVRRERASIDSAGIHIEFVRDKHITERYLDLMHTYYCNTNQKFGPFAAHFLNRDFFLSLSRRFAHRLLLCSAFHKEERALPLSQRTPVAISFLLHKNSQLYGRYWGENEYINNLHFELCYYAPIEWAINHRCDFFDPGIGGEHKIRRGLHADERYTLLRFEDSELHGYLNINYEKINGRMRKYIQMINEQIPFKKPTTDEPLSISQS